MSDSMSTTSYAVLGMLGIRPWKPYDLTQQMLRSLAYCWPISERAIYNEPERLVRLGYASRSVESSPGRSTRTYAITPAGRAALASWLGTRPAPPRLFNEPLLRLLLADQGQVEDLRASLTALHEDILADRVAAAARMNEYLEGTAPFPERAHLVAAFADLTERVFLAFEGWARDTLEDLDRWPSTQDLGLTDQARARLEGLVDRAARAADGRGATD